MPPEQSNGTPADSDAAAHLFVGNPERSEGAAALSALLIRSRDTRSEGVPPISRAVHEGALSSCDSGALGGPHGPARQGLVISPITAPFDASAALSGLLRFPSADLVHAAAGLWPRASRRPAHFDIGRSLVENEYHEFYDFPEGPLPSIEIAPGLVRMRHTDHGRADRRRKRIADDGPWDRLASDRHYLREMNRPMALSNVVRDFLAGSGDGKRGAVAGWSRDSRARLVSTILELDLASFVAEGTPCMVTLTMPGDWEAIAPDAAAAAAAFHRFDRAYRKRWGRPLRCIWKREFQRRGAPHWHLWTVPPTSDTSAFRAWLSRAWTIALKVPKRLGEYSAHFAKGGCSCSEYCRSLRAGTGVDFAEGLRSSDPKRLAVYFLKESLGGEGKAYQNEPPASWAGQSVGRYWGVRGLEKVVATVAVEPVDAVAIFRVMRRVRLSHRVTREVLAARVCPKTGVVRFRRVRRRVKARGSAGWVAVNDGAAFGSQLAELATALSTTRTGVADSPPEGGRTPRQRMIAVLRSRVL